MKFTIDEAVVTKLGMDLPSLFATLLVKTGADIEQVFSDLIKKEVLVKGMLGRYSVTPRWNDVCNNILLTSEKIIPKDEELEPLALELMNLVPQTKMPGTPYYYKCNKREIILKLKKFFKLYGFYPYEDIINATKRYVASFNGDYRYMKLLKYFIMKDEKRTDSDGRGYIEETSMLATELENKESSDINSDNWVNELK